MAHRIISDEEFQAKALELFRTYGFQGVSLKDLAEATGLEKASLYYRFPGGKDEIVMAVAADVVRWFEENVFAPLAGSGTPRKRVLLVCERLREFYANGAKSCITDVLSIPGGTDALKAALKGAMQRWIQAFAEIARASGFTPAAARVRAEEAIVRFEGSLVMSRVLGDNSAFERIVRLLPDLLTTP
jgi:AcrR family transcriptional regulator